MKSADLLFHAMALCYEQGAIIVTSHRVFTVMTLPLPTEEDGDDVYEEDLHDCHAGKDHSIADVRVDITGSVREDARRHLRHVEYALLALLREQWQHRPCVRSVAPWRNVPPPSYGV
jgi:hypothetical protein